MKIASQLVVVTVVLLTASAAFAVPIESVDSARASDAFQKVDAFLGEQAVADQLVKLGVTPEQAKARLAQLSDAQLEELAAQVDTLRAGGMIQGGHPNPLGPIGCVFYQIGVTIKHVVKFLFCWTDIR